MPRERHFTARLNTFLVREADQIKDNLTSGRDQIVDARASGRFTGAEADFWPGARERVTSPAASTCPSPTC